MAVRRQKDVNFTVTPFFFVIDANDANIDANVI